jgi:hypothetical protein
MLSDNQIQPESDYLAMEMNSPQEDNSRFQEVRHKNSRPRNQSNNQQRLLNSKNKVKTSTQQDVSETRQNNLRLLIQSS